MSWECLQSAAFSLPMKDTFNHAGVQSTMGLVRHAAMPELGIGVTGKQPLQAVGVILFRRLISYYTRQAVS